MSTIILKLASNSASKRYKHVRDCTHVNRNGLKSVQNLARNKKVTINWLRSVKWKTENCGDGRLGEMYRRDGGIATIGKKAGASSACGNHTSTKRACKRSVCA